MQIVPFDGWPKRDGNLELFLPRNAGSVTLATVAQTPWVFTSWTQLVGTVASNFVMTAIFTTMRIAAQTGNVVSLRGEFEIGTGPAGTEVTIARVSSTGVVATLNASGSAAGLGAWGEMHHTGPTLIGSGSRVAIRSRLSADGTVFQSLSAIYLGGYDGGAASASSTTYSLRGHLAGIQTFQSKVAPDGTHVVPSISGFPNYGAYSELVAAVAGDCLVWGIHRHSSALTAQAIHLQLATGPAGTEQPRATIAFPGVGIGNTGHMALYRPFIAKNGERLSVRSMGGGPGSISVMYEESY